MVPFGVRKFRVKNPTEPNFYNTTLCSPRGTPTFRSDAHGTWSMLDLVFSTDDMEGLFMKCDVDHDSALPGADHLPVHSVIDTHFQRPERTKGRNFKEVDWADFTQLLCSQLQDNGVTESLCLSMGEDL